MARMPSGGAPASGHRALVTGASSGIGRATAFLLAEAGWDLVLVSRSSQSLGEVVDLCADRGSRALMVVADVGDEAAVGRAFTLAERELGGVDAVVHSAAALAYGRFEDVASDVFRAGSHLGVHGRAPLLPSPRRCGGVGCPARECQRHRAPCSRRHPVARDPMVAGPVTPARAPSSRKDRRT